MIYTIKTFNVKSFVASTQTLTLSSVRSKMMQNQLSVISNIQRKTVCEVQSPAIYCISQEYATNVQFINLPHPADSYFRFVD